MGEIILRSRDLNIRVLRYHHEVETCRNYPGNHSLFKKRVNIIDMRKSGSKKQEQEIQRINKWEVAKTFRLLTSPSFLWIVSALRHLGVILRLSLLRLLTLASFFSNMSRKAAAFPHSLPMMWRVSQ